MDERLEKALDFSNFRMILAARQENLKVLLKNRLLLTYGGGIFSVDSNLISFVRSLISAGENNFILIDNNDLPIHIEDLNDFWDKIITKYKEAMSRHHASYTKLREAREIRKVLDWNEEKTDEKE